MYQNGDQIVLQSTYLPAHRNIPPNSPIHNRPIVRQQLSLALYLIPAIIAICILVIRLFRPLLRKRPLWMRNFVTEPTPDLDEPQPDASSNGLHYSIALLVVSVAGLSLQIVLILYPSFRYIELFPTLAWVCVASSYNVLMFTSTSRL